MDILESCKRIELYIKNLNYQGFFENSKKQDAGCSAKKSQGFGMLEVVR